MTTQRVKYCGPYQQAWEVRGCTKCPHTKRQCPFGLHACSACGKQGHGAEDCWLNTSQTEVEEPQVEPSPPLPATSAWPTSSPAAVSVPMPAEAVQHQAQFVPGFGKKEKERLPIMVLAFHLHHPFRLPLSHLFCPAVLQQRLQRWRPLQAQ